MSLGLRFQQAHDRLYRVVAGELPHPRIWHSQWLAQRAVDHGLSGALSRLRGDILDVGCGSQPYRHLVPGNVVGADIAPGPSVDVLIPSAGDWPIGSATFDGVLCTQVLEHAVSPETVLSEIRRVLRPDGIVVLSVPFSYHEHGAPSDYRRWSRYGATETVARFFDVERVVTQGWVGTLIGTALLAWVDTALIGRVGLVLRLTLFPAWLTLAAAVNILGAALNRLDRSGAFYSNVLIVARRV